MNNKVAHNQLRTWKIIIILCFCYSLPSLAQQTTKKDTINPSFTSWISHTAESVMEGLTFKGKHTTLTLFPIMGYSNWSGLEYGVMPIIRISPKDTTHLNDFYRPTTFVPSITYSTKGQLDIDLKIAIYTPSHWSLETRFQYTEIPDTYYGIGHKEFPIQWSHYISKNLNFSGELTKGITKETFLGLRWDVSHVDNKDIKNDFLNPKVPGYQGGFFLGLGPIFKHDTRDNIVYPSKGHLLKIEGLFYPNWDINDYHFFNYKVDYRQYINLPDINNVLALQGYVNITDGTVPFYKMSRIAGKELLRGIDHPNKYLDKNSWYTQAEFRKHLWWRVGGTIWAGMGNTFSSWDDQPFSQLKWVVGLGGRFQVLPEDRLNFRGDVGFGPGGDIAVYMTIMEAF